MPADSGAGEEPVARPRTYSREVAIWICDHLARGRTLIWTCRTWSGPGVVRVREWLATREEFAHLVALAMAAGQTPVAYSHELGTAFCRRLARGEDMARIYETEGQPSLANVQWWLARHPEFAAMHRNATELLVGRLMDEVRTIADQATSETLQLSRTRIAARQWVAVKLAARPTPERGRETGESGWPAGVNVEVVEF